jgi:photosystem II stability/assembly factor-like uncharacterized protein
MRLIVQLALAMLLCQATFAGEPNMVNSQAYKWQNVRIVGGGFVTGIITHPTEKGLMYARTDIGGAYRWDANAGKWIPLLDWVSADEWNLMGVESIAVDPEDVNAVYIAAGTYTKPWAGNGAILRSHDRGKTWQRTDMPFKMGGNEEGRQAGERLVVDPHRGKLWFGSRNDGLWRGDNDGQVWNRIKTFPVESHGNGVGIAFIVPGPVRFVGSFPRPSLYAGVSMPDTSLYVTNDGAVTWEPVKDQPKGMLPIHGAVDADGMLYVTYGNAPGPNGMTDGAVWRLDTKSGKWTDVTPLRPKDKDRFGYAGLTVDRQRPGTLMVSTLDRWGKRDEIFRSTDKGATWKRISPYAVWETSASPYLRAKDGIGHWHWIGDIEIDPHDSNRVYYVTGATVMACMDVTANDKGQPTHWSVMADGIEETVPLDVVSPPVGAHLISAVGDICGFTHDDLGASPQLPKGGSPFATSTGVDFAGNEPLTVVRVGDVQKGVHGAISTDGGKSWKFFESEPNGLERPGAIAISADGKTIVWSPPKMVPCYSADGGKTWTACKGLAAGMRVISDRVERSRFYATGREGQVYASDGTMAFTMKADGLPKERTSLRAVPGKAGHLALAAADGLYLSMDGGEAFARLPGVTSANRVGFGMAAPGKEYPAIYVAGKVGTTSGFFRSDDMGASWTRINDDQHQYGWVNCISGDPRIYGRVYIGTGGRGILYGDIE